MTAESPGSEAPEPSPAEPERPARPPLDASGMARPRFVLEFPADEQLDRLVAAFERGDYLTVRQGAEELARQTDRDDVRRAALELRRRIDPDPLARFAVIVSAALLVFLVLWTYLGHDH